ncbi:hypothetical protein CC86DRAFT_421323 [Ophiobolus disseminans]|uniref:Uncharacterized protein n=1 Tax=Ophiobolus disseminans TaxID=1469910 RepID=A0A6A6ZSH6_9PLEO|nr:hypothetical protein CC86DRAFT_421323 [Ophiobolus disseminans]
MPARITVEQLEAEFKQKREAARHTSQGLEKSSETTSPAATNEPVQPQPRRLSKMPIFYDGNPSFGAPRKETDDGRWPSTYTPHPFPKLVADTRAVYGGSPLPRYGPIMSARHGTRGNDRGFDRHSPAFDSPATVFNSPPRGAAAQLLSQDLLRDRGTTRETAPRGKHYPVIEKYKNTTPYLHSPSRDLVQEPQVSHGSVIIKSGSGQAPQTLTLTLLFSSLPRPGVAISTLHQPPPKDLNKQTLDKLRKDFDTKLKSLEERLERRMRADAQPLSPTSDLEMRLEKSEAEKEKYRKRVVELEKKVAALEAERKDGQNKWLSHVD